MATGPEHYHLAEQLLDDADASDAIGQYDHAARLTARAHAHATLALAAAATMRTLPPAPAEMEAWRTAVAPAKGGAL